MSESAPQTAMLFGEQESHFNWDAIAEIARRPIVFPGPDCKSMLSPEWKRYEHDFHTINACRLALLAWDAAWRASGTDKPNPYPPVPYMQRGNNVASVVLA